MMGWSPKCYIPRFKEIGPLVPEKKIFEVFTIYGRGGHYGHVTSNVSSDFHFLVPESFHTKIWFRSEQKFLKKSSFNVCMYTTLGQGQEMTLTFNTHISSYI